MLLFVASRDKSRNRQFALIAVCSNDGGHGQDVARSLAGSLAGGTTQARSPRRTQQSALTAGPFQRHSRKNREM